MKADKPSAVFLSGILAQQLPSPPPSPVHLLQQLEQMRRSASAGGLAPRPGPSRLATVTSQFHHPQQHQYLHQVPSMQRHPLSLPLAGHPSLTEGSISEPLKVTPQLLQLLQRHPLPSLSTMAAIVSPISTAEPSENKPSHLGGGQARESRREMSGSENGGRLAISFLLNENNGSLPEDADVKGAGTPQEATTHSSGHKRKLDRLQATDDTQRTRRALCADSTQDRAGERRHVRRRVEHQTHYPSNTAQTETPPVAKLPSLSSLIGHPLPTPTSGASDLYSHSVSPQRPSPEAMPSTASLPSTASSSDTLSLSAANHSFFFHSFNCLRSASTSTADWDRDDESSSQSSCSSASPAESTATDPGKGFYYVPYERSRSLPTSPKLSAEDDSLVGEDDAEPHENLDPAQLQLRLQSQALRQQLLLRQRQRTRTVQQLKSLHAKQRRQREGLPEESTGRDLPESGGEASENAAIGEEVDSETLDGSGQHIEDKLKLLKMKIMSSDLMNDGKIRGEGANTQEKRKRATPQQLRLLEDVFALDPFPAREAKQLLAQKLGMSTRSITIWFQNKRARLKKNALKD